MDIHTYMCINITILDDKEKKSGLDIEIGKHQEHCYAFQFHIIILNVFSVVRNLTQQRPNQPYDKFSAEVVLGML